MPHHAAAAFHTLFAKRYRNLYNVILRCWHEGAAAAVPFHYFSSAILSFASASPSFAPQPPRLLTQYRRHGKLSLIVGMLANNFTGVA